MPWKVDVRPKRWKLWLLMLICLVLVFIAYFAGVCDVGVCHFSQNRLLPAYRIESTNNETTSVFVPKKLQQKHQNKTNKMFKTFMQSDLYRRFDVDFINRDVIVFLHIQKTGGTALGRKIVRNLDVSTPCKCIRERKRCDCLSTKEHVWLFSRYSTGWICGLHADWTELTPCVENAMNRLEKVTRNRRYLYITILRDPIKRYISEWKHVERGATWRTATLKCNGRSPTKEEVPFCYEGEDWSDVTLDEFLACPHNLATNRQTRMLANLTIVNCYNSSTIDASTHDELLLSSAKENLRKMSFFGILEYMNYTQMLFEDTFNLKFTEDFVQYEVTHITGTQISYEQYKRIAERNRLDIQLYEYAKALFLERVAFASRLQRRPPRPPSPDGRTPPLTERDDRGSNDLTERSTLPRNTTLMKDFTRLLHAQGDPFQY